ncbi:YjaG family protein, partial [Escherichia coli]
MLQNPIHLRLERLESWQHVTFMACLCERMYPNYAMFCQQTGFGDGQIYRRILDLIWETLTVKDAKVNFDSQLEKFEEAIPSADDFDLYGVYPAIDACVALSELVHSRLSGETLEHAVEVSKTSITTVAMLEMTQAGREMSDEELKENPAVEQECVWVHHILQFLFSFKIYSTGVISASALWGLLLLYSTRYSASF